MIGAAPWRVAEAAVTHAGRRRVQIVLAVAACAVVAYWAAWFGHRSLVASETSGAYYQFENAFPLADGWLFVALAGSWWSLRRRRPAALFWLLAGGGAGVYLFCMDVLYDLEHGIWGKGGGGAIELVVNVVTLASSVGLLRWSWRRRRALGSPPAGDRAAVG